MKIKLITTMAIISLTTGCASSAYQAGVNGNVENARTFNSLQIKQLETVNKCYENSTNKSECSIVAAGLNSLQMFLGKPDGIRVAKSTGEIIESITKFGLEQTVTIFGYAAVAKVANSAFEAAKKDPVVTENRTYIETTTTTTSSGAGSHSSSTVNSTNPTPTPSPTPTPAPTPEVPVIGN